MRVLHGGGHQSFRVAGQPPDAVDLLDHPAVAVRARHLLDDERHTLGLRMHDGRAARVDRAAEDRGDEVPGLGLRQAIDLHPAEQAHPVHVRQQVHGLGHQRELLGPDREHQEDRARGDRADHVPEHAEAVVVGPLQVIDQDGERSRGCEGAERDGAQIERAQEPAIGRQRREAGVVLAGHRVEAARERLGRLGSFRGDLDRFRGAQDGAREQEGAAELLVRGDRDRREPCRRRHLGGGEQQPGLPDPGFAFHREPRESSGRRGGELLADRVLFGLTSHDGAGRPMDVQAPSERTAPGPRRAQPRGCFLDPRADRRLPRAGSPLRHREGIAGGRVTVR